MTPKLPRGTLDKLWNDPVNWRARSIYNCKADPRLVVRKRNKWAGWTLNFAHGRATLLFMLGIGFAVAVILWCLSIGSSMSIFAALGVLVVTSLLSYWQSSSARFEERD